MSVPAAYAVKAKEAGLAAYTIDSNAVPLAGLRKFLIEAVLLLLLVKAVAQLIFYLTVISLSIE